MRSGTQPLLVLIQLPFDRGLQPIILAVSDQNHNAIKLFLPDGFALTESAVCFSL